MTTENFQVDLRGIVEILSHHLYSSPRVFVRELIQNARDALVARERLGQSAASGQQAPIELIVDEPRRALLVRDAGIGLTEQEARQLLSTIGASSKRGEFAQARRDYLGQFGIGLLSCFLVADQIEVRSRSARESNAPTMHWIGSGDGTFTVTEAADPLEAPGTEVWVRARPEDAGWVSFERVELLASKFAGLLPVPITVHRGADGSPGRIVSRQTPPWQLAGPDALEWCLRTFGMSPLAAFPIDVPVAGVRGLAFVSSNSISSKHRGGDRVFSNGMFVADDNTQLVPEWATFVKVALEAGSLTLTASRESLQETELVRDVQAEVGRQLRTGIERLAAEGGDRFKQFLDVHSTNLLAMAAADDAMLQFVARHYLWETSSGLVPFAQMPSKISYASTVGEFSANASLVSAQGGMLVNGGYTHSIAVLEAFGRAQTRVRVSLFSRTEQLDALPQPKPERQAFVEQLRAVATPVLDELGVGLDLRDFAPASVLSLHVPPPPAGFDFAEEAADDDPWAALTGGTKQADPVDRRPKLVLNVRADAVRAVVAARTLQLQQQAVRALYLLSLLQAGQRLNADEQRTLADALGELLVAAT
ncbi:HSP90 family protein [Gulosibacter sediminis]|uniref:HSP90 family protein n=1 Tax=Gulosibacter sediminis TaxID=1729695 RepID=UPI0024AE6695|nr:HSP90 family protein [Gulosibacter sediminis]